MQLQLLASLLLQQLRLSSLQLWLFVLYCQAQQLACKTQRVSLRYSE
jgi:hypothetical protein